MAINVSQAFHRTSANPVDDTMALTKAEMLTVNDNLMPSKYLTVCQDDGKIYLYDKSATASAETGKFVEYGGGHAIIDSEDTELTQRNKLQFGDGFTTTDNSTDEQTEVVPTVMTSADMDDVITPLPGTSVGRIKYSTDEQVVGEWINGKPIYQLTHVITDMPNKEVKQYQTSATNIETVVEIKGILLNVNGTMYDPIPRVQDNSTSLNMGIDILASSGKIQLKARTTDDYANNWTTAWITIQYTKTTD